MSMLSQLRTILTFGLLKSARLLPFLLLKIKQKNALKLNSLFNADNVTCYNDLFKIITHTGEDQLTEIIL